MWWSMYVCAEMVVVTLMGIFHHDQWAGSERSFREEWNCDIAVICDKSICSVFWYAQFSHFIHLLMISEISLKDLALFMFVSLEMRCPSSDSVSERAEWLSVQNLWIKE